jgi:hypothetical protein
MLQKPGLVSTSQLMAGPSQRGCDGQSRGIGDHELSGAPALRVKAKSLLKTESLRQYKLVDGLRLLLLLCDTVYKAQAVGSADASNVVPAWTGCE